jgi:uncharacterized protein
LPQIEIVFIIGKHKLAIEVKSTTNATKKHLSDLQRFTEEYEGKKAILVCNEPFARVHDGIYILPCEEFLKQLWNGDLIS